MSVIKVENRGRLRIILIDNIKKRNALNRQGYMDLTKALRDADNDDSVSVVAVTGVGDFYSSGNDLAAAMSGEYTPEKAMEILRDLIRAFFTLRKILIAVVNGPAIGIAATTAALCDVIYAEKDVRNDRKILPKLKEFPLLIDFYFAGLLLYSFHCPGSLC